MPDHLRRMQTEARSRLHDAALLSAQLDQRSDSASLLRVLAFEVLLKCAALASGISPNDLKRKYSHSYAELWGALPHETIDRILASANERMPGHTDFSNLAGLLKNFETVFKKARYYYEFYEDQTLSQQTAAGNQWISRGAPLEEALIRYHPYELESLVCGLNSYIDDVLSDSISREGV